MLSSIQGSKIAQRLANSRFTYFAARCGLPIGRFSRANQAPDCVADVIGDQKRAIGRDCNANGSTARCASFAEKAGQYILRFARRFPIGEGDEDHLVTARQAPVPRTVLANEGAVREAAG